MSAYGVVLFPTASAAFRAEKALLKRDLDCKLIVPPRQFSSDCGVAAQIDWSQREKVEAALKSEGIKTTGIHPMS